MPASPLTLGQGHGGAHTLIVNDHNLVSPIRARKVRSCPEKLGSCKDRNLKRHPNLFSLGHNHHYSETVRISWESVRFLGESVRT